MKSIGVVVIGRNEGERLRRCFDSVAGKVGHVVYVDSGSTDGSVALAEKIGVAVVELDMTMPFTAARGRNAGFFRLMEISPGLKYVQFVDGDCEVIDGWLHAASDFLFSHLEYAVVCGQLRERFPEASVYNQLCDIEWDSYVGEINACGGIFMIRSNAFNEIGGMNKGIVAGEEPEMCLRLKGKGWKIARIEQDMAWHDAAMTKFGQWWKRAVRSGYAYAQGCLLHGAGKERYRVKECLRIWVWGLVIPLFIFAGSLFVSPWCLLLLGIYPFQFVRIYLASRQKIVEQKVALIYAGFTVIDKWPQLWGQLIFFMKWISRQKSTIIEYR